MRADAEGLEAAALGIYQSPWEEITLVVIEGDSDQAYRGLRSDVKCNVSTLPRGQKGAQSRSRVLVGNMSTLT